MTDTSYAREEQLRQERQGRHREKHRSVEVKTKDEMLDVVSAGVSIQSHAPSANSGTIRIKSDFPCRWAISLKSCS